MWAAAEGDGQAKDDDRPLAVAAAVAAAAEQRTHHAKCTTVSFVRMRSSELGIPGKPYLVLVQHQKIIEEVEEL